MREHLGAALGTGKFKILYLNEKVEEMKNLSTLAWPQPHASFSACIHVEQDELTYFYEQWTV